MIIRPIPSRVLAVAVATATAAGLVTGLAVASSSSRSASLPPVLTPKAVAFHDAMRELWEDHGAFTRMAISSFASNSPDSRPGPRRTMS